MKFAKMPEEPEPVLAPSPTLPPEPEPTQSSEESSESIVEDKEAERQEKLTQLQQQVHHSSVNLFFFITFQY